MILNNFKLSESSNNLIGISNEGRIYNKRTFIMLNNKRKSIDNKFGNFIKEDHLLLFYYITNPIKLDINRNTKFKISKNNLNEFFNESKDRKYHKEIYGTKLFNLVNPYYLVKEKGYINSKYIDRDIINTFTIEKENLKERDTTIMNNKFYDKINNLYFELPPKDHELNKISNERLLNEAIRNHCYLVRIKNEEDDFKKILLLRHDFTVNELITLIKFIYKSIKGIIVDKFYLYYNNNLYSEVAINDINKTMRELSKEMRAGIELEIFIQMQYEI